MDRLQQTLSRRRFALTAGVGGAALAASAPRLAGAEIVAPEGDARDHGKGNVCPGAWSVAWRLVLERGGPAPARGRARSVRADVDRPRERVHLLAPEIDLTTHIDDVLGLLEYEDLTNVVLVGHSYAGIVISGVAERAASRLAQLVYLDAFLPEDGATIRDYSPGAGEVLDEMVKTQGDGWRLPSFMFAADFGVTDADDAAWVNARLGDQPYKTFTQPLDVAADPGHGVRCAYILTTQDTFVPHAERAQRDGFDYYELFSAGHDSMVTQPAELVGLFLSPVRQET